MTAPENDLGAPRGSENPWSVIVCAYTEDRWTLLAAALESVRRQTRPPAEVVLVVDHNPALLARAQRAYAADSTVVVANTGRPGLAASRNVGAATATQPLVAFLDDDAVADSRWLETLEHAFADENVIGVGGRIVPQWPTAGKPHWFPDEFLWTLGCSYHGLPDGTTPVRNPIGANMAFRSNVIDEIGGFTVDLGRVGSNSAGGEETEFSIRATRATGGVVLYRPDAVVTHTVSPERVAWAYFRRRCYHEGRSKAQLARHVGAGTATASERSHLVTLGRSFLRHLIRSVATRERVHLDRAAALFAGTAITGAGFIVGMINQARDPENRS